jgi:hypothetical protein
MQRWLNKLHPAEILELQNTGIRFLPGMSDFYTINVYTNFFHTVLVKLNIRFEIFGDVLYVAMSETYEKYQKQSNETVFEKLDLNK